MPSSLQNAAKNPIPAYALCAAGVVFLALTAGHALRLPQGGTAAHVFVLLALLLLAILAVFLLSAEKTPQLVVLAALLPIGLAFFFRSVSLDYSSYDYRDFLSQWAAFFRENGGFAAIRLPVSNYNVPYLYFMAAISYLPVPDLYLIKIFSILFDVLLAWGGLRLAKCFCRAGSLRPALVFCLLLLLPTVVLNGAYWGQCDSLYGALVLHALACALSRRPKLSVLLLAVAFSFKLQTVFLIPLWCVFWYAKRVKFSHLCLFPLTYAGTILPALLTGKPLGDILGVYLGQTAEYGDLTLNAPSVYALIPYGAQVQTDLLANLGICAAFALVLALLGTLFVFRKRITGQILLAAAAVLAVGVPFLLPHMHDRYFFLADVIFLVWACVSVRQIPLAVLVQCGSLSAYATYLRLQYTLPIQMGNITIVMGLEALCMLVALLCTCAKLWTLLENTQTQKPISK